LSGPLLLMVTVAPDRLLTAEAVARMLGVPKSWIYEQSRRGLIPTVTLGRYRRSRREAIEARIEEQEAGKQGRPVDSRDG
jgi:excisionase family DNA binding protein